MKNDQLWDLDSMDKTTDFLMNRREFITIAGGGIFLFLHNKDRVESSRPISTPS